MLLRIGATPLVSEGTQFVPAWEIAVSLISLTLGTFLMMRFATKVFEVGMLMTGKSASLQGALALGTRAYSVNALRSSSTLEFERSTLKLPVGVGSRRAFPDRGLLATI